MKWRSVQVRFIAARRGAVLAAVAVAGLAPAAGAQGGAPAPTPDALCRCFVGDDSTGARAGGRGWALLGAAGLALLAGVPVGGGGTAAIPFVEGPPGSPLGPLADVAAVPPASAPGGTVVPVTLAPGVVAPLAVGPLAELPAPTLPPGAFVPPKTATHLPLLAAAGVLLMGGGGLLARHQARRQRRRRRRGLAL